MATVVSHAMRRIATTPDANYSSCGIRSEKSRLSWTQEGSESALSRSMRYADPWLYDGVRGSSGLLLAPALVLCSCQDYLNGTKRSSKNKKGPSPCKKCKGTRIPLSNGDAKFGTMRCYPTTALAQTPVRAGTVRVTSGSRPSILPSTDPYDLMRRSRLTVGDNGSQFRARSVSPNKGRSNEPRSSSGTRHKNSTTKYSTVGRRSILECNVNPYELMSAESDAKDASITLLNGQRIRVRPPISDYEDVDRPTKTKTKTRPSSTSSSSSVCYSPKSNEKESESSRFKSILKKPSTTFSDTDSSYETSSNPSPLQQRSGSHFYLPMPVNGPRKKVQFLVENELVSLEHNGDYQTPSADEGEAQEPETGSTEDVTSRPDESESKRSCKLKRSESDRALKEDNNKVIFHDSMALRSQNYRTDSRIVFTDKDLERLDGIYSSRFGKTRPADPPPEPPKPKSEYQKHHDENYEDIKETGKLHHEHDKGKSKKDVRKPKIHFEDSIDDRRKPKAGHEQTKKSNDSSEGSKINSKKTLGTSKEKRKVNFEEKKTKVYYEDTNLLIEKKQDHYEDLDEENYYEKEKQISELKEKRFNAQEKKIAHSWNTKEIMRDNNKEQEKSKSNEYKQYYDDINEEKHHDDINNKKERRSSNEHKNDVYKERSNPKEQKQVFYEDIIDDESKLKEYYEDINNDKRNKQTSNINEEKPPSAPPRKRSNNKHPNNSNKIKESPKKQINNGFTTTLPKEGNNRKISLEDEVFEEIENNYEDVNLKQTTEPQFEITLPLNDETDNIKVLIKTHGEIEENKPIRKVSFPEDIYESIKIRTDTDTISINSNYQDTNKSLLANNNQDYDSYKTILTNDNLKSTNDTMNKSVLKNDFEEQNRTVLNNDFKDPNKTVLKINTKANIHKLKIKNEFQETNNINTISITDNTLGKTSIMINGDDCYSTIKVCDEIPLYHSSVVVTDTGSPTEIKKSSSVYITGNFVNTYVNGNKSFDDTENVVEKDTKETEEVVLREKPSMSNLDLLKCLSDPVEAVRMNLVPHVCGKSDPPRRPKRSDAHLPQIQTLSEEDKVAKFIEESFLKLRNNNILDIDDKDISSEHSSSTQYEIMDQGSECYTDHSNRSSITEEELNARTKFYELLADSSVVEVSENEDHHYESIKMNPDPIYEEIEIPPPLPSNPPPSSLLDDLQLDKEYTTRSIFEGASKYDILSYLVDAKERGIVPEDSYTYNFNNTDVVIEEEAKDNNELPYNRVSHLSTVSDSSEDSSLVMPCNLNDNDSSKIQRTIEVERNDSGVGSETSKSSLSKYRVKNDVISTSCEDCESLLENLVENEPLICRKCLKKRTERKEIITEIVETEEKYSRDLQIILEEFYQPMLVAGLLTSDQLSAIFLNVEELLENSQALAERLRDAVEIAIEQGDEDLQTVNIGKLVLEAAPMLHAFETYCVRQGPASLLLASLEKEKELLRIFLRVSQMENTVLRRMNLNSFLMVPVQRVTKYPLLLARLYKVTPTHHDTREQLKEAQHKIELHLNHMNSETKDVPSKLWRRISSIPGRRSSSEMDLVNIKLRKIAVDVLEWNHDEAKFALEGRLLFTQPTDNNWRKGRTIKLTPVNALLVTNGKSTSSTRTDPADESLVFSRQAGVRDAALLLVRDKNGRYSLLREPLYLDRCVIAADPAWQSYFEVQELLGKDTFIFKAEDEDQTKIWYRQLQYYAQGMGAWRKRRNALANIMINGMGLRS